MKRSKKQDEIRCHKCREYVNRSFISLHFKSGNCKPVDDRSRRCTKREEQYKFDHDVKNRRVVPVQLGHIATSSPQNPCYEILPFAGVHRPEYDVAFFPVSQAWTQAKSRSVNWLGVRMIDIPPPHSVKISELKKSDIKMYLRGHSVWVQPWVLDAVILYKENEGYADLSTSEFLNKMKPDNTTC